MTVIIDKMEKGGVKDIVRQEVEDFEMRANFGCDYIAGEFCIERKQWQELPERMMNNENDLYMQLAKTMNTADELGKRPALLLEGPAVGSDHTSIPVENVMMYLNGAYQMDLQVMVSTGRECTAKLLAKLDEGSNGAPSTSSIRDPDKVHESDRPQYILEGLPGVGPSTALDLLDRFGAVRDVARATPAQLEEVDGVGPATSEKVHEAFIQEAGR